MNKNIRIVILAAGSSERLGQPKQLLPYRDRSLILRCVMAASEAVKLPPIVVTGAYEQRIRKELQESGVEYVHNPDWPTGIASSLRTGLRKAMEDPGLEGVLVAVSDQPFLTAGLLSGLISAWSASSKPIVACRYKNTAIGTPVLFSSSMFSDLLNLSGQEGARKILRDHPERVGTVDFPLGGTDIDTMEDYNELMA